MMKCYFEVVTIRLFGALIFVLIQHFKWSVNQSISLMYNNIGQK